MLTKWMYLHTDPREGYRGPFDLYDGQMDSTQAFEMLIWYNQAGEVLGCGQPTDKNLRLIFEQIPDGEAFVVVPWEKIKGDLIFTDPATGARGFEQISLHRMAADAKMAVLSGMLIWLVDDGQPANLKEAGEGLIAIQLERSRFHKILERLATQATA